MEKILTTFIVLITINSVTVARDTLVVGTSTQKTFKECRGMNFFIISKPTKIDPGIYFQIMRTRLRSIFKKKKFRAIVVSSSEQMSQKIIHRLKKHYAVIRNLWFDSHGRYANGYASFLVGTDEFSYMNINDTAQTKAFRDISVYCDSTTRIGIGSCYGGATFKRAFAGKNDSVSMYGDSLMKGLSGIFNSAIVFGSESWVMTKPGLFREKFALAGSPLRKRFRDKIFMPVWERLGHWNVYFGSSQKLSKVNCVMLDGDGNIKTRFNGYQSLKKVKKKIARNVCQLKPNMLKI